MPGAHWARLNHFRRNKLVVKGDNSSNMKKQRFWQLLLTGVVATTVSAAQLWARWPIALRAQDTTQADGAQSNGNLNNGDDKTGQAQIFLPFVSLGLEAEPGLSEEHNHGQPLFESWPPQPIGIKNIQPIPAVAPDSVAGAALIASQNAMNQAEQIAIASSEVQAALGDTFVHAATIHPHSKPGRSTAESSTAGKDEPIVRVAYFSYSNNVTVEVHVQAETVVAIEQYAASDYQPEPTVTETFPCNCACPFPFSSCGTAPRG